MDQTHSTGGRFGGSFEDLADMSATETAAVHVAALVRRNGESVEAFAARRYAKQMEVYSAYGGYDFPSWDEQSEKVRKHWIDGTREMSAYQ